MPPSPRSAGAVLQAGTPGIKILYHTDKESRSCEKMDEAKEIWPVSVDTLSVWKKPYLFYFPVFKNLVCCMCYICLRQA